MAIIICQLQQSSPHVIDYIEHHHNTHHYYASPLRRHDDVIAELSAFCDRH
jgi:hypothetical protein